MNFFSAKKAHDLHFVGFEVLIIESLRIFQRISNNLHFHKLEVNEIDVGFVNHLMGCSQERLVHMGKISCKGKISWWRKQKKIEKELEQNIKSKAKISWSGVTSKFMKPFNFSNQDLTENDFFSGSNLLSRGTFEVLHVEYPEKASYLHNNNMGAYRIQCSVLLLSNQT